MSYTKFLTPEGWIVDPIRKVIEIPFSDMMPVAEATAQPGTAEVASRGDHKHPRLTSSTTGVIGANGEATVTFTRSFAQKPGWIPSWEEAADNQPVEIKVKTWITDGEGNYTGCVIKAYRAQTVPQNLVSLLLGGVFNLFAGSAAGVSYSFVAIQQSS